MQDPTLDRSFRGHRDVITDLSFKPSMTQIASGSMDNSVMVWNFKPQMRAFRFVGHKGPVTSVDFSPSGNLLASASRDQTVRLWTPNVKGDVTVFKAHTSAVRTVRFSHDGESFLTCSDDKSVKVWSAHRAKFQYTLAGHMNWVRTARFSPDSKLIVSGGDDKSVKLWDLASKNCIKTYWDHTGMVTSTAFHPAGTIIATASTDKSIKLFDIRTHKLIQHYHDAHVGAGPAADTKGGESAWAGGGPNSIAFGGPGGNWLISTGMDGVVKIWDLKEGHLFYTLHGHKNGPTTAAVFSPEGAFFATGGSDSQVMVWKSNFDAGVPLNADDVGAKYKSGPGGLATHTHASHPIHTEPTAQSSFFTVGSKTGKNHSNNRANPILDSVTISQHQSGITQQRKLASMNSNLVTTLPTAGSNATGKKSPQNMNVKGYDKQGYSSTGGDDLAGMNTEAEQPEIVSVGGPLLNRERSVSPTSRSPTRQEEYNQDAYTTPLEMRTIPDELANSLQHIISQIDVLTQTMSILERRLTSNEDRVTQLSTLISEAAGVPPRRQTQQQQQQPRTGGDSTTASSIYGRSNPTSHNVSFVRDENSFVGGSGGGLVGGSIMGKGLQEPLIPRSVHVQTQRPTSRGGGGNGSTSNPVFGKTVNSGSPVNLMN